MNRYKINKEGDKLIPAPKSLFMNGKIVKSTDELLAKFGYVPLNEEVPPELKDGETLVTTYEYVTEDIIPRPLQDRKIKPKGKFRKRKVAIKPVYKVITPPSIPEPVYTYDDYDNAMEDYIRQVRIDRGYTLREPSGYKGDPYPRFAQDAEDFILFRSLCMQYALPILNRYKETGEAPTMEEFKAGFPKCAWTYQEEV